MRWTAWSMCASIHACECVAAWWAGFAEIVKTTCIPSFPPSTPSSAGCFSPAKQPNGRIRLSIRPGRGRVSACVESARPCWRSSVPRCGRGLTNHGRSLAGTLGSWGQVRLGQSWRGKRGEAAVGACSLACLGRARARGRGSVAAVFACAARVVARNWGTTSHQNRVIRGDREKDRALPASLFPVTTLTSLEGRVIGQGSYCLFFSPSG